LERLPGQGRSRMCHYIVFALRMNLFVLSVAKRNLPPGEIRSSLYRLRRVCLPSGLSFGKPRLPQTIMECDRNPFLRLLLTPPEPLSGPTVI
jgi:hypothetical protein